jgi:hypothetical protein
MAAFDHAFRIVALLIDGLVAPPVKLPLKPNFTVAFDAREPFHDRLFTLYRVPVRLTISAFQIDVISKLESNSKTQPLVMADPVVFFTVISPPKPGNHVPVTLRTAVSEFTGGGGA